MNRHVLRIGTIAVGIAGVGLAVILLKTVTPTPPTGPLALVEPQVGSDQALTSGVLEISDDCVRLIQPDGTRSLVIWSRGSVTWNATDRSIAVSTPDSGVLTVRSGDAVSITGGGGSAATIERAGSWFRRPAETCEAAEWFLAAEVRVAPQD